jgi:hypothetical protein
MLDPTMLQTTFKIVALIWLGTTVIGLVVLAALYLFEAVASEMRRKLARRR